MSSLVKTSTFIDKDIQVKLKVLLKKYDISLREFIEYSYLFIENNADLQQTVLLNMKHKLLEIKNGNKLD